MALLQHTNVGLRATGRAITVPNDPVARLMYYLDCCCVVLQMDDHEAINRFRRYNNYYTLDRNDKDMLLYLCTILKPDVLIGKCFFESDRLCGDTNNEFYELSQVQNNFLVAGNIMINGQSRRVNKIMTYKQQWMFQNWINPMQRVIAMQRQERQALMERQRGSACNIL